MAKGERLRRDALGIWKAGVRAVNAGDLVRGAVRVRRGTLWIQGEGIPLNPVQKLVVVGAGKAGASMAQALERQLGSRVLAAKKVEGWVNVPDSQVKKLKRIVLHGARSAHENVPMRSGVVGSVRMWSLLQGLKPQDLVVCLISGGGSALWPSPAGDVTLTDKKKVTALLHASGATIEEMNAVRKHLSRTKGGGVARATRARVVSLLVSDVVGDRLDVIASGPTTPDPTTYSEAIEVLERYRLLRRSPPRVVHHLRQGARGVIPETLKRKSSRVSNHVVGSNKDALAAAEKEARTRGYRVRHLLNPLDGESRDVGEDLARLALASRDRRGKNRTPICLLSGGETTVTLGTRPGKGGRNQELVLSALHRLWKEDLSGIVILSGGTDGEDGPTDAAGAVMDEILRKAAHRTGVDPKPYLDRHDAYRFFDRVDGLFRTGPTHTNVMDLRVVLVG